MNLRLRVLAAFTSLLVLVAAGLAAVAYRQQRALYDQVDFQVTSAASVVSQSPLLDQGFLPPFPRAPSSSDFYVGLVRDDGSVTTINQPVSQAGFSPPTTGLIELAQGPAERAEFRVDTISSPMDSSQARAVVLEVSPDIRLIIARTTDQVDEAIAGLVTTAFLVWLAVAFFLALVLFWIDRLGLQPIGQLTEAVEAVASGYSESRVEHPPTSTETGRLGAAFNTMLDRRQRAEHQQRQFVANASHELRTPLTTLRGYTALYQSGGLTSTEKIDDAMVRINSEAARMSKLVDQLLTLASLDDGQPLNPKPVDLSRLLCDLAFDASAVQPNRPIDSSKIAPNLIVSADQDLLTQALTALTTNALRHTETEAELEIGGRAVPAESLADRHRVRIWVRDAGPGIDSDQLPFLFDRFHKGRSELGQSPGRGLGLSIAQTIIDAHDGTIEASSTVGLGTEIIVELPLLHSSAETE